MSLGKEESRCRKLLEEAVGGGMKETSEQKEGETEKKEVYQRKRMIDQLTRRTEITIKPSV